jgi:hypothetical protein
MLGAHQVPVPVMCHMTEALDVRARHWVGIAQAGHKAECGLAHPASIAASELKISSVDPDRVRVP